MTVQARLAAVLWLRHGLLDCSINSRRWLEARRSCSAAHSSGESRHSRPGEGRGDCSPCLVTRPKVASQRGRCNEEHAKSDQVLRP